MPSSAMASVAATRMTTRSIHGDRRPSALKPAKAASAVKAPTVSTSPCENLMTSSTPKNSVKPTATSAYIMPSISPFMTYCANSPRSIDVPPKPGFQIRSFRVAPKARTRKPEKESKRLDSGSRAVRGPGMTAIRFPSLLLHRQLALARGVFAVVPFHELAVLHHVFGDDGDRVLAVIVERDLADDRVAVLDVAEIGDDLLAVGSDLLDGIEDHVHGGIGEGAVGLRRLLVFLRVVLLHEEPAAGQLLGRRALAEGEAALGERPQPLDEGVGDDAGGAVEHRLDAELVHLLADAHADRRQAAEVDDFGIERLDLGELGGEVLLVGRDAEGADDLGLADAGERLAEVFVVALAVVGGVVNHGDGFEAEPRDELGVGVVLVDHGAVDAVHLVVLVAVGDVGQHGAPHDHREAEFVVGVDGGDRGRRAVVRGAGDDLLVGRHL